jgi:hypothetical protein
VTAPAHVEFDSSDPHGTLKVSHEINRVRAAANLDRPRDDVREGREWREGREGREARKDKSTDAPAVTPPAPRVAVPAAPVVAVPRPSPASPPPASISPASVAAPVPAPPTPPQVDADPERTITSAVRACESTHVAHATGVVVTVNTSLELHVADTGMVESARFDPPLAPDVQQCAVHAIYGTRFSSPGAVSIPIDFTQ